jgi:hypothetical protein
MKEKIFISLVSYLLLLGTTQAQVQFNSITLKEALEKAKSRDKIVLVYLEPADCNECNDVAMQGFSNPAFARSVNDNCVPIKIKAGSKEFNLFDSLYSHGSSYGTLYINSDGELLHKFAGTTSFNITNMEQLDKALNRKEHPDTEYIQLRNDYNAGKRDFVSLYKLVAKKNELDQEHDLLTEEMLNLAPKDSATSLSFIEFIAQQAPMIDSKAFQYMRKDGRNYNDAWYLMPQQKRVMINNKINYKSKRKAIKDKDSVYAEHIAAYAAGTYTDKMQARKSHDRNMIDFYKGIKDTARYLSASINYYDRFLMTVSVDSVQRADSMRQKELVSQSIPEKVPQSAGGPLMRSSIRFAPSTQYFSGELNDGAFSIYTYTHDPLYNAKALVWAKRATEFYDSPPVMDTYARLLYRTGNKEEAIAWQEKAFNLSKERKMPANAYEEILNKMKAGEAAIDKY